MKDRTQMLTKWLAGLAIACGSVMSVYAQAEENILFDNSSDEVIDQAWAAEGATGTGRFWAQEFITGSLGLVSSVTLHLAVQEDLNNSSAAGVLNVEIWDSDKDRPGSKVASLGTVNIPELELLSNGGGPVSFERPILRLKPNTAYFVVLDYIDSKAFVVRRANGSIMQRETVFWLVAETSGTEADPAPAFTASFATTENPTVLDGMYAPPEDYNWINLKSGGRKTAGIMTVTESAYDLPIIRITSVQRSNNAISLVWNSLPFEHYIVEFSEDPEMGSWMEIDDFVKSGGAETELVDSDPSRLAAKRGFYRVRRARAE